MKRELRKLEERNFDLLVVGGGITGACIAWDAALRGLSVALVEQGDFGESTSAASSKLIHGGVRYLQQGMLHKVRESQAERRRFLRAAPHLLRPVPFLIPTYGHGLRGKEVLTAGLTAYELLGAGLDRGTKPAELERFRLLGAEEVRSLEPLVPTEGLTGGAVFPELHMHSSERMTLSFVLGAAEHGACVANRLRVTGFLGDDARVTGVRARDLEADEALEIRAGLVVNTTGPWAFDLLGRRGAGPRAPTMHFSKGCHLVLSSLTGGHAIGLATRQANEALVNRGGRHIFFIPWRGKTLVGTTNVPFAGHPDEVDVTEQDIADFLVEIGSALQGVTLTRDMVSWAYGGLYPLVDVQVKTGVYQGSGEYRIWDHRKTDRVEGLVTVLGAKFTTALRLAERAVDGLFRRDGRTPPPCRTNEVPVPGGETPLRAENLAAIRRAAPWLDEDETEELASCYGSRAPDLVRDLPPEEVTARRVSGLRPTLRVAVEEAVRNEMALGLPDVVFRRTGLGTIGHPGDECLRACAEILAREHGWSEERRSAEIDAVDTRFRRIACI